MKLPEVPDTLAAAVITVILFFGCGILATLLYQQLGAYAARAAADPADAAIWTGYTHAEFNVRYHQLMNDADGLVREYQTLRDDYADCYFGRAPRDQPALDALYVRRAHLAALESPSVDMDRIRRAEVGLNLEISSNRWPPHQAKVPPKRHFEP